MSVHRAYSYTGLQYYGNSSPSKMEVHHVPSKTANCQLDEIRDGVRFNPDTLEEAHTNGYDNCHYCLGGSTR
jgi:hypothetical protein